MNSILKSGLIALYLWIIPCLVSAQVADSIQLAEILVLDDAYEKERFRLGATINRIQLQQTGTVQSLAEVLQTQSGLFLRNQGAGSLATLSQNGFAPHQTRVEWNGMEINHPMVGVVDFSMIPSHFLGSVEFSSTYSFVNPGAMALGGVIQLESPQVASRKTLLQVEQGQFGRYGVQLGYVQSQQAYLQVAYQQAKNNFEYNDPVFGVQRKRSRNASKLIGIQAGTTSSLLGKPIRSTIWAQTLHREIPGAVGTSGSDATQLDEWIRWANSVQLNQGTHPWKLHLNGAIYRLNYRDSLLADAGSDELSKSLTYKTQLKTSKRLFFNHVLWSDVTIERLDIWVETNNYESSKFRGISRFTSHSTWQINPKWHVYPIIQIEHFSDFGFAISPSLGISWEWIPKQFQWYANGSRAFTPPSLNALYWPNLGDPNLKPEDAYKMEFGYRFQKKGTDWSVLQSSSILWADISNGIQWIPIQSQWRPQNILEIEQRAFNSGIDFQIKLERWQVRSSTQLNVVRATIAKSRFEGDGSLGKQLMYVPDVQVKQMLEATYRSFLVQLNMQRVGNRFINLNNSNWLDPYQQVDVFSSYQLKWNRLQLQFGLHIQNLTNEQFSVVQGYPVPGRNYTLTLSTTLN